VDFGFRVFQIEYRPRHFSDDGTHYYGTVDYTAGKIILETEHADDDTKVTLLHEICHVIESMYQICGETPDEQRVEFYAQGFAMVFRLNPKIAKLFSDVGR